MVWDGGHLAGRVGTGMVEVGVFGGRPTPPAHSSGQCSAHCGCCGCCGCDVQSCSRNGRPSFLITVPQSEFPNRP